MKRSIGILVFLLVAPAVPTAALAQDRPGPAGFGTVSVSERIRQKASDTIKKHDKNGNGILEGVELKELGMSRGADRDDDAKITHNELVAFYSPEVSAASKPPAATPRDAAQPAAVEARDKPKPGSVGESETKRKIVNTKRKSYRFTAAKDHLPASLPGWFRQRDANGDGQVAMSEYGRSWSDRTAAEFRRYDRDNDGMIAPDEAR